MRSATPPSYEAGSETVDARDPSGEAGREQVLSEWVNPEGEPAEGVGVRVGEGWGLGVKGVGCAVP